MNTVGGYRLVRRLGEGRRAQVYLGHAGSVEPVERSRMAAVKIYRPETEPRSIDAEIDALARCCSRHILELTDLATGPDGRPCLILPRLGSASLGRLLSIRPHIRPGEAVTILIPLVEAVAELHRVGIAHRAISPAVVLFDSGGAPVLAGFGAARSIGPTLCSDEGRSLTPAQLDDEPLVAADRSALLTLVRVVLDRIDQTGDSAFERMEHARRRLDEVESAMSGPGALSSGSVIDSPADRLADVLFGLADGEPIDFDGESVEDDPHERSTPMVRSVVPPVEPPDLGRRSRRLKRRPLSRSAARDTPDPVGDGADTPFTGLARRIGGVFATVRRPVWIAGGAGVGALIVALTVIPAGHSAGTENDRKPVVVTGSSPSGPPTTGPSNTGSSNTSPLNTGSSNTPRPATTARAADDPVAAVAELVAARTICFDRRSMSCLSTVDQAGSAVIEADEHLMRSLAKGATVPILASLDGYSPELNQRLGDSAIFTLQPTARAVGEQSQTTPASLLVVRSEAGWRIRDLSLP